MDIFIQALGLIGMVLMLSSYQFRQQKTLIRIQCFSSIVFTIHYLMLGATTGAILNLIGIGCAYVFSSKEHEWARRKYWLPLFCGAYIIVYFLTFAVFGMEPTAYNLILEVLPVIGCLATTLGFHLDNMTMRKLAIVNSTSWLVYNIFSRSLGGALTEIICLVSIIVGILRLNIKKKE